MPNIYQQIKPKPTRYKGIRYRSKLEAQWAYLFDLYDLPYLYEPNIRGIAYLPDFELPQGVLLEIKPEQIPEETLPKLIKVAKELPDYTVLLCSGSFYKKSTIFIWHVKPNGNLSNALDFTFCEYCGKITLQNKMICPICGKIALPLTITERERISKHVFRR